MAKKIDIDQEINEIEECKEIIKKFEPMTQNIKVKEELQEAFTIDSLFSPQSLSDTIDPQCVKNEEAQVDLNYQVESLDCYPKTTVIRN